MSLIDTLVNERSGVTKSVMEFEYNRKRVRILSGKTELKSESTGVIYWMSREMRVQDNWSFLFAQKLALKNKIPLYVIYFFMPESSNESPRHLKFMLHGLLEVYNECYSLDIPFYLHQGEVYTELPKIVEQYKIGAVICDFSPLRIFKNWLRKLQFNLPKDVVLCQVDGHNIVPCWLSSDKQEYAARTIRPKIMSKLDEFLTTFPAVIKHLYTEKLDLKVDKSIFSRYDNVELPQWIQPGYKNGIKMLESFCKERLENYSRNRNNPPLNAASHLSPWINYGQIAPQRCVLEVTKYQETYRESFNSFCEELIIRRELSDNFCYYNEKYDQFEGCAQWAQISLNQHKKDKRNYIYTSEQFEEGRTHDPLWNASQMELVNSGKIHGYIRMYWAKKILEWTESPEKALEIAIYLNDKYSFDGRDPNGYVGIMWSIGGVHDQGWSERPIYGKVRYMSYDGCARKFVVHQYIQQWGRPEDQINPPRKRKRNT